MERVVNKFGSFREAEQHDTEYWKQRSADERIAAAKEIIARVHPDLKEIPDIRAYHRLHERPAIIFRRY